MSDIVDLTEAEFLHGVDDDDGVRLLAGGLVGLGLAAPDGVPPTVIGCPSFWGRPRRARLNRALAAVVGPVPVLSRAALVAASHCDASTACCAVIEALPIPGEAPGGEPGAWSAHLLSRTAGEWRTAAACAGELGDASAFAALIELIRRADMVLIDGPDADELLAAVADALPDCRRARVDRVLLRRQGARAVRRDVDFGFADPPAAAGHPWPQVVLALTAAAVLALGVVGLVARWPHPPVAEATSPVTLGPVRLTIPADWKRTELAGDQADDGRGLRAVFADGRDGRRLIVVVTALRAGATTETVAQSLANRIAQRGEESVVEFAADARYGGRQVISYREAPASGPPVHWYVVVDGATQISVGCQAGTGGAPIDPPCRDAVASAAVES